MIPPEPPPSDGRSREALALVHHHPGRLRVRAEAFRSGEVVERVHASLDVEPGINSVTHNPKTGSLLVEYEPGLVQPEVILLRIASAADLDMPPDDGRPRGREPAMVAIDTARELNELVHEVTGFRADLRTLVPAGMAALAAYSFMTQGDRLPRWDNLLYWSYNVFSQLHRREIDGARSVTFAGAETPPTPPSSQPSATR